MKNAICLHGISSGLSEKALNSNVDMLNVINNLKENLIIPNECDVFIHTWRHQGVNELLSLYKPNDACVEDSILFYKNNLIDHVKHLRRKYLFGLNHKNRKNDIMSRWYSLKKSVNLATKYSHKHGFVYDKVFVTRFDLMLKKKIDMDDFISESFYTGNWSRWFDDLGNELNEIDISRGQLYKFTGRKGFPFDSEGLHDFWFASNANSIEKFSLCYDNLENLFKEVGFSSHKIALKHLEKINLLKNIDYLLEFPQDYTLGRWC